MKKCCGLLLVLCTMLGLSFVVSSDVNALKHEWSALPLFQYVSPDYTDHTVNLNIVYYDSSYLPSGFSPVDPIYFTGTYSNGICTYNQIKHGYNRSQANDYNYYIGTFYEYFSTITPYDDSDYRMCQIRNHAYSSSDTPRYNWDSVPTLAGGDLQMHTQYPKTFAPYWFKFDGFYIKNEAVDSGGVHYSHSLRASELFGVAPGKFEALTIPLAVDESVIGPITAGRPIEISGVFLFDGATPSSGFSFSSGFTQNGIFSAYMRGSGIGSPISAPCSITTTYLGGEGTGLSSRMQLSYSCVFSNVPATQYPFFYLTISDYTDHYVWDTDIDWSWAGMFITTDNDSTPGSDPSVAIHAANPDDIPGSATTEFGSDDSADWFSSLTNLFNFNVFNPFAPIFQMFTDNSECASIPIIAGMLHSQDTSYCPWFSSDVRNILSPVLGLSSVMLLFGFFVRWLSSSSGNMFEDQTTHKWGNVQIKQKGK